jgi:alkylglycerol monooxygenase
MPNPIALAVPFFFLLMGVELFIASRKGLKLYRFSDVLACLGCGMAQQVSVVFEVAVLIAGYTWLYGHRYYSFPAHSIAPWVIAFFYVDFVYYWWHRLSHEVNFLWAAHVVHHQSEDYNLAVALRQAILTTWTIWPFHLPLALIGVPPLAFGIVSALSTLYQFWIHTELIDKMGWFEWVFNTPAQHRVHHAINPKYLDKNYAATLCIWDRLFGTYEPEVEQPVYGLVKPLGTFDPLFAQVHYLGALAKMPLRNWLRGPAFGHPPAPDITRAQQRKHSVKLSPRQVKWLAVNFVVVIAATTFLMWNQYSMPLNQKLVLAGFVFLSLAGWGAILEGKRWVVPVELARAAVAIGALIVFARA